MSNVSDLLQHIGASDSEAIGLLGDSIGVLADISGVGAAVDILASLLDQFTSTSNQAAAKLEAIQTAIAENFAQLHAEQRAAHILDRLRDLDPAIAQAQSVLDELKSTLLQVPPVTPEFKKDRIRICLEAIERLDRDDKWLTVFADEIYYGQHGTDLWSGEVLPTPHPTGLVFSSRYILPLYLRVLHIFMLVAAAYEPNYQVTFKEELRRFTERLRQVYETSSAGIVPIRLPNLELVSDFVLFNGEYGAVHTYSGYSDVSDVIAGLFSSEPVAVGTTDSPGSNVVDHVVVLSRDRLLDYYALLRLGSRGRSKDVYIAVGLGRLRKTIDSLRKLTGDPPLLGRDPSAWSFREIDEILVSAFKDPSGPLLEMSGLDTMQRLTTAAGSTFAAAGQLAPLPPRLSARRPLSSRKTLAETLNWPQFPFSF